MKKVSVSFHFYFEMSQQQQEDWMLQTVSLSREEYRKWLHDREEEEEEEKPLKLKGKEKSIFGNKEIKASKVDFDTK